MEPRFLKPEECKKEGKYMVPNIANFNSVFSHNVTCMLDSESRKEVGRIIAKICRDKKREYFKIKQGMKEIGVYPNDIIEEWLEKNRNRYFPSSK